MRKKERERKEVKTERQIDRIRNIYFIVNKWERKKERAKKERDRWKERERDIESNIFHGISEMQREGVSGIEREKEIESERER